MTRSARWAGVATAALLSTQVADAFAERRYAVVVGNNRGRGGDERPLRYAERDAQTFASVLRRLGGVPAENTVLMLGETSSAIRRAILEVNARIRAENELDLQSTLIVYYSGHADADGLHPGRDALSYDELRAMLRGSPARVRLLVLDGCRSGELTHVKGGAPADAFQVKIESNPSVEGMVMITSRSLTRLSREKAAISMPPPQPPLAMRRA